MGKIVMGAGIAFLAMVMLAAGSLAPDTWEASTLHWLADKAASSKEDAMSSNHPLVVERDTQLKLQMETIVALETEIVRLEEEAKRESVIPGLPDLGETEVMLGASGIGALGLLVVILIFRGRRGY